MISLRNRLSLLLVFFVFGSICFAQYGSRKITCEQDTSITFPIFSSENKAAAKKINDHLQMEFFETTTSKTPEAKLFDEFRYILDDSVSQSGYTFISYSVELNDPKILSVIFDVEGMGAYPTYYQRYFSFDTKTGKLISPDTMFTIDGLKSIKILLIDKRNKEIKKWIAELKAGYREPEDSTFVADNFAECNAKADEENFFVKKGKVLFYKHDCFPHAWKPYETNLDIEFTYKEIEKYLSAFGKMILSSNKVN